MVRCLAAGRRVDGSYELRVATKAVEHACVLATHWTVYYRCACLRGYSVRGSDRHCAVDDGYPGSEEFYVTSSLKNKVLDLKWIADMQEFNLSGGVCRRRDVHPKCIVMLGSESENGPSHLTKSDYNDFCIFAHD